MSDRSFDSVIEDLRLRGGGMIHKRQLEKLAVTLTKDFALFYDQPYVMGSGEIAAGPILVISADAKGIPMHIEDLRKATRQSAKRAHYQAQARGHHETNVKNNRKRMATAISVYEIAPHWRTIGQIIGRTKKVASDRPKPKRKRVWAGVVESMGDIIDQGFAEAQRRDPEHRLKWVVLIDGQEELICQVEAAIARYNVVATILQDYVHVQEYVWKAAHELYPDDIKQQSVWVDERLEQLLAGHAQNVASGMRRAATRRKVSLGDGSLVAIAARYIENNKHRLVRRERCCLSAGANPARQLSLRPVATGAAVEVTKWLKPLV